jgi:hypothetical protein
VKITDARTGKQVPGPDDDPTDAELPETEELDVLAHDEDPADLAPDEVEPPEDRADPDPVELDPTDETEEPGEPDDERGLGGSAGFELLQRGSIKDLVEHDGPLLFDARSYQERWDSIQIGFVDEPLYAVESAGRLLAEVLGEVASTFASKRKDLESQWRRDREVSTEELRLAFRGYRAFFQRVITL